MVYSVHFPVLYQSDTVHPNLPHKRLRRSQVLPVVVLIILRDDPPEHSFAVLIESTFGVRSRFKGYGGLEIRKCL